MVHFTLNLTSLKDEFPCQDGDDQTDYNYFVPVFINEDCLSYLCSLIRINDMPLPGLLFLLTQGLLRHLRRKRFETSAPPKEVIATWVKNKECCEEQRMRGGGGGLFESC